MDASNDSVRSAKIMMAQFRKATKDLNELVKFAMDPDKPNTWYALLCNFRGNNNEYAGGEYLARIVAPPDFPYSPPSFYFMNETGVYGVETKVCISIGEYHKEDSRAALGMDGFIRELVNGLIGWKELGGGIAISLTPIETKIRHAKLSAKYIREKYPAIIEMIDNSFKGYSAKWDLSKVDLPTKINLGLPYTPEELATYISTDKDFTFFGTDTKLKLGMPVSPEELSAHQQYLAGACVPEKTKKGKKGKEAANTE